MAILNEFDQIFGPNLHVRGFGQQGVNPLGKNFDALLVRERGTIVRKISARTVTLAPDAGLLQFQGSAGDRVGINEELMRQHPNRQNLLAGREPAGSNQILHLVGNLQINQNPIRDDRQLPSVAIT